MSRIANAGLKTKLVYISLIKLVAFIVIFVVIYCGANQNNRKWSEFQNDHVVYITALYSIHKSIGYDCGIHAFKNYVLRKEAFYYNKSKTCFQEALATLKTFETTQRFKADVIPIRDTLLLYLSMLEELKVNTNIKHSDLDNLVKVDDGPAAKSLENLETTILEGASQLKDEVRAFQRTYLIGIGILFVFGFITILALNTILGANLVRKISNLQNSAMSIADGDLTLKIKKTSEDELGKLAGSLDRMRIKLKKYVAQLKSSNKELEQFAYVTSHDLQEPLRKIISYGDLLQKSSHGSLDEKSQSYLSKILDSSVRMRTLIDDLLSYSMITSGKKNIKEVDLESIVSGVLSDLEIAIEEAGAEITVEYLPKVMADPSQMRQLFQNLISNAVKFRSSESPLKVYIKSETKNKNLVKISIEDNGIGIEEKFLERIFIPFQRLHARSEYSGTGIGLAVCSRIVDRHNSKLEVQSRLGEGSSFSFELRTV